jgi:hypothetical protein
MKHEYTEGCTCTSLSINDIDVNELPIEEIRKAVVELILQIEDKEELIWEWRSLMRSVGHYEDLGHCDTCGDNISNYTVNIE